MKYNLYYINNGTREYGPFNTITEAVMAVKYLCDSKGGTTFDYPIVSRDKT